MSKRPGSEEPRRYLDNSCYLLIDYICLILSEDFIAFFANILLIVKRNVIE
jgi:hypothetical protein